MSIKSDKWIKRRSVLENFSVKAIGWQVKLLGTLSLKTILDMGVDINFLSQALHHSAIVFFNTWDQEPQMLKLKTALTEKLGQEPAALEFCINEYSELAREPVSVGMERDYAIALPLIYPFFEDSQSTLTFRGKTGKCPSYGLTSYGYDIRLGNKFKICQGRKTPGKQNLLDFLTCEDTPSEDHLYQDIEADAIDLLPGQFMLGVSMEWVNMPNNAVAVCMQKSSLARKGCMAFVTPLEPGWRGFITLEIVNHTEVTQRLYAGMGMMQLEFMEGDERCEVSYSDRGGKYMNQVAEPVMSIMA